MLRLLETREDGGKLKINRAEASILHPIRNVPCFRVIMTHPVRFQFGKNFASPRLVDMLDTRSAVGGYDPKFLWIGFDQSGHKWTALLFKESQNADLVGKSLVRFWAAKGLVNLAIISEPNRGPEGVFHLFHRKKTCFASAHEQA